MFYFPKPALCRFVGISTESGRRVEIEIFPFACAVVVVFDVELPIGIVVTLVVATTVGGDGHILCSVAVAHTAAYAA